MSEGSRRVGVLDEHLPPEVSVDLDLAGVVAADERFVVLDDDPTGNQTVHGIDVLARWDRETLHEVLSTARTVFLLTNSRALEEHAAVATYREIAENLREVAASLGVRLRVASRSDSTLRGHFPAEVEALLAGLGPHGCLLVPCFVEGGRLTFDDVHWVREGDTLVPAGETPYSEDATFGYASSNLLRWIEEKTAGAVPAASVASIGIDDLRSGDVGRVAALLEAAADGYVVANAVAYSDLEVLVAALRRVEDAGRSFVYRCGASFVRVRAGVEPRPLLEPGELDKPRGSAPGGLVVCGSHVPKTTAQLARLLEAPGSEGIELDVRELLDGPTRRAEAVATAARSASDAIRRGRQAVVFTSRTVVESSGMSLLEVGARVSQALVDVVAALDERPAFLVAKGGITAHDLATRALAMRRATVLGQIAPGVSVWRLRDGPSAGTAFVVFPGNVGDESTLGSVVERLAS